MKTRRTTAPVATTPSARRSSTSFSTAFASSWSSSPASFAPLLQNLRPLPLHHQQGDHRPRSRPHSPAPGHLRRPLLFFLFACSAYITQTTFFKINFVLNFNVFHCLIFFLSGDFQTPANLRLQRVGVWKSRSPRSGVSNIEKSRSPESRSLKSRSPESRSFKY